MGGQTQQCLLLLLCLLVMTHQAINLDTRPNVLFIMSDDLRPELGCYVRQTAELRHLNRDIITTNIDRLAKHSMLFTHAFSQYPLCNPSRSSLLTGRSPQVSSSHGYFLALKTLGQRCIHYCYELVL